MKTVFLSYSSRDYFFAEMLALKLDEKKEFKIWRDSDAIRAGDDWRESIENGIKNCTAVVVALSESSAESPYVTYEWAYAAGMGKTVIPVSKVRYGFGGGPATLGADGEVETATGGGGGVQAEPVGVFEITEAGTRFVPVESDKAVVVAAAVGFIAGLLIGRLGASR